MTYAAIEAAQRRRAKERDRAADQRKREWQELEMSERPDPQGRTDAEIRAALLAYQLPPEAQAQVDAYEADQQRAAKAQRIRARVKAKKQAEVRKTRARAKVAAREAWLSWAPTTGPMAGISLTGRIGRK